MGNRFSGEAVELLVLVRREVEFFFERFHSALRVEGLTRVLT